MIETPAEVKTRSKTGGVGNWSKTLGGGLSPTPCLNNLGERHMFPLNEVANPAYPGDNGDENYIILVYKPCSKEDCNKAVKSLTP